MRAVTKPTRKDLDAMLKKENLKSHDKGKSTAWEEQLRDRVLLGFINFNRGYEAWKEWCEILYEPDAIYHVRAPEPLNLEEYQKGTKLLLDAFDLELQPLDNLLIEGDWGAVRYNMHLAGKPGGQFHGIDVSGKKAVMRTMEFFVYKYNPEPIGPRVKEGWSLGDLTGFLQQLRALPEGRIEGEL